MDKNRMTAILLSLAVFGGITLNSVSQTAYAAPVSNYDAASGLYYKPLTADTAEIVEVGDTDLQNLKVPGTIGNYTITAIGTRAFRYETDLISIQLPNTITSIGDEAFYGCAKLQDIQIPNNVKNIGSYAFENCDTLTSISIPSGVTKIAPYLFFECDKLNSVELLGSITSIGECAFYQTALTRISLPDSLNEIGANAFEHCKALKSVDIPKNVEEIKPYTFYDCTALSNVQFTNGLQLINDYAFCCCDSLKSVELPQSLQTVGVAGFARCHKLTDVIFPDEMQEICERAFMECDLKAAKLPQGIDTIAVSVFEGNQHLAEMVLPDSVKNVKEFAFHNMYSLGSLTILNPECVIADAADTIYKTAVIVGDENSNAKKYANTYGRTFKPLLPAESISTTSTTSTTAKSTTTTTTTTTTKATSTTTSTASSTSTSKATSARSKSTTTTTSTKVSSTTSTSTTTSKTTTSTSTTLTTTTSTTTSVSTSSGIIPTSSLGDINGDGIVSISDAILLSRILWEDNTVVYAPDTIVDLDGNGIFNLLDIYQMLRLLEPHCILIDEVQGKAGETVRVPIRVYGDKGTAGGQIYLSCSPKLIPVKISIGEAYDVAFNSSIKTEPIYFAWIASDNINHAAPDGAVIAYVDFRIPSTAAVGETYSIAFAEGSTSSAICDMNGNTLNVSFGRNGSVTVVE